MLELLGISSLSFMIALSGAMTPGPLFMLVVSESLRNGKIAGPLIVTGHLFLEAFLIIFFFLGLKSFLESKHVIFLMGVLGSVLLILMGLRMLRDALRLKASNNVNISTLNSTPFNTKSQKYFSCNLIISGILSSVSNPYFFLWWLSNGYPLLLGAVSIAGSLGFLAFLVGHALADFCWFSFVGYSIHRGKSFLKQKILQGILLCSGFFLLSFAIYLLLSLCLGNNISINVSI